MHPKTLTALQNSIEHWARLATSKRNLSEDIYAEDCALCSMFHESLSDHCTTCPVKERTGQPYCEGTPWRTVERTTYYGYNSKQFLEAASIQLAFLKSLLPEHCHSPLPSQNQLNLILL